MKRASEKEVPSTHKKPKSDAGHFRLVQQNLPKANQHQSASKNKANGEIETIVLSSDEENDNPQMKGPQPSTSTSSAGQDLRNMGFTITKTAASASKQAPAADKLAQAPSSVRVTIGNRPKRLTKVLIPIQRSSIPDSVNESSDDDGSGNDEAEKDENQDVERVEPQSILGLEAIDDEDDQEREVDELDSDSDLEEPKLQKVLLVATQANRQKQQEILKPAATVVQKQQQQQQQQQNELVQTATLMRKLPVRESRNKVTTYNDIANSVDPSQFAVDYLSSGDDESEADSAHYGNAFSHSDDTLSGLLTRYNKPNAVRPRRSLKTGFVYDTAMSYHATPDDTEIHPEDPRRIFKIFNIMERRGLLSECKRIRSRRATKEEILLVHNITHYRTLRNTSGKAKKSSKRLT
ncbi:hypothetical protein [Parasitella parasitica]|uniref:Uncharacterized protein n=1 Tax=Parasitella parasitica TaxID=35722 RepID=A0A0B7N330_9FUNG|nr:hypothetical protein [Parasitella parasitica]